MVCEAIRSRTCVTRIPEATKASCFYTVSECRLVCSSMFGYHTPHASGSNTAPHHGGRRVLRIGVGGYLVLGLASGLEAFSREPPCDSIGALAVRQTPETSGMAREFLSYYPLLPSRYLRDPFTISSLSAGESTKLWDWKFSLNGVVSDGATKYTPPQRTRKPSHRFGFIIGQLIALRFTQ
jgi:hypothetical protein